MEAGIGLENEEALGTQREGEEAPCQRAVLGAWTSLSSPGTSERAAGLQWGLLLGEEQPQKQTQRGEPVDKGS